MAELVKDLNNHYFIVTDDILTNEPSMQHAHGTRIPITGTGQLEAARQLYGEPRENADLTGYYQYPGAAVDYYGGPGEMEKVVAGEIPDPVTGKNYDPPVSIPEQPSLKPHPPEEDQGERDQEQRDREEQRQREELSRERAREQENARQILRSYLREWGLEDIIDQTWESVKEGKSRIEIVQEIRDTDEWAERFSGIVQQQNNDLPVMSESEYLEAETSIRGIMRSAGMPRGFYDDREQIGNLLGQYISPEEVSTRVQQGWREVTNAPVEVREEFRQHLGIDKGDRALATYFIDPDKATEILLDEVEKAFIGGHASRFDLDVDEGRIDELHALGIDRQAARQGFAEVALQRRRGIFRETIGERGQDLTAEDEGIDAMFEQDPNAIDAIERRQQQRAAAFAGPLSRVRVSGRGTGLGSAGGRSRLGSGFRR